MPAVPGRDRRNRQIQINTRPGTDPLRPRPLPQPATPLTVGLLLTQLASMSRACRVELPGVIGNRWKTTRTDCNTRNMKTASVDQTPAAFQFAYQCVESGWGT